jgi:plastocyanin
MRTPTTDRPNARWRRGAFAALFTAAALVGAACGDTKDAPSGADQSATAPATEGAATVTIDTFMFTPEVVRIQVGDTVTWTNNDSILHTVTSGAREYDPQNSGLVTATNKDGLFDMQLDGRNATESFTFTEAGTFHYFCDRHPGMEADIEVS